MKINPVISMPVNGTKTQLQQNNENVPFTSLKKDIERRYKSPINRFIDNNRTQKQYRNYVQIMTEAGKEQAELAHSLARKYVIYKNPTLKKAVVTEDHYYLAYLEKMCKFALDVKSGEKSIDTETHMTSPAVLLNRTTPYLWENDNRDKLIKNLKQEVISKREDLKAKSVKNGFISSLEADEKLVKDTLKLLTLASKSSNRPIKELQANDAMIMEVLIDSNDKNAKNFLYNLSKDIMTSSSDEFGTSLPYYDNLSRQIIKNTDKNYNVYVTYSAEDEKAPEYFINNLVSSINNENMYNGCKNLKPENTDVTVFNDMANIITINKEIQHLKQQKDKNHIVVINDFNSVMYNSTAADGSNLVPASQTDALFKNNAKNIHLVLIDNRDKYYYIVDEGGLAKEVCDFQNIQIPIMDSHSTKTQLVQNKKLFEKEVNMEIEPETLELIADVTSNQKGSKYDNATRFIKQIASYYKLDESVLKPEHVALYLENTRKENAAAKDGSYDIIFDTKTTADDIIGSPMVKQQVKDIAYEIKNFPSTKGYVVYNIDGVGGGRYKAAKAIAGEAKIPLVTIDAADYAIKDLDTVNQDPMDAINVKISKLINLIKSQSQTNTDKTVMLFIANFDRFGSDPLYGIASLYEQQAFKKLITEMKKIQNDDSCNMIVVGSSDNPEFINENIQRQGLFNDEIVIYPPRSIESVKEVIKHHSNKKGYKFEKGNEDKIIDHSSKVLNRSSYIDITNILDKANILASKKGKDSISIEDINETYMTEVFGPTNELEADDKQKELIIRHEGGHALNLQFMYNLLKEKNDSLRIPDVITNITLDPRGDFLGCVTHDSSPENSIESNLETVLSRIVCCFGGNSAEEHFYDMNGSWGISQDRQSANHYAKTAVLYMGLGANLQHYIPDIEPENGVPILGPEDSEAYSKDVKAFLVNGKILSDKIVKCYSEFLEEFSKENLKNFGTGKCIITGDEFEKSLKDWENKQPPNKKKEIYELKKQALRIIECTRDSEFYTGLNRISPKYRTY